MTTHFYHNQSSISNTTYTSFLQHKFGVTKDELERRNKWKNMGYFLLTYSVLFNSVAQTEESQKHLEKLLKTIRINDFSTRQIMSRSEYLSFAQQKIESCLLSCEEGFYVREVDQLKFHALLHMIGELLKDLDSF
jgi:hypothetical protein